METGVLQYSEAASVGRKQEQTLDSFFVGIEKRAYRMANLAVHNDADALDIVQEAMIKLSVNYGDRSSEHWRPLFYKILENLILDFHRKEQVKKRWFFWRTSAKDDEDEILPEQEDASTDPVNCLSQHELSQELMDAIGSLPVKQQQCFLLRCWEGLSVKETAQAMGVNEGSVKTHYHRAVQKLQAVINEHEDEN